MGKSRPKSGGKDFKKGQSGNPGGLTKEQAKARNLTREGLKDFLNLLKAATHEEMEQILGKPETTAFTMMVVKVYMAIIEKGDMQAFDKLMDRLVGKVKDEVDVNVKPLTIKRRDGTEVVLGREE